jgi:nucleotide-binding universal stress UspA family protein
MAAHSPVVVGFDFSVSGEAALTRAVAIAARAPYHVLHVACVVDPRAPIPRIPSYHGVDASYAARVQEALAAEVHDELERQAVATAIDFFVHARIGKAAPELLALAREVGADLIVVGSHGLTGVERFVVGSVSARIVREAGCTVEVARAKQYADKELPDPAVLDEHRFVPPHRYQYADHRVLLRPTDWPLS